MVAICCTYSGVSVSCWHMEPELRCSTPCAVLKVPNREKKITSLDLLSVLLTNIWLLLFAAGMHFLLVLNMSTRTRGFLTVELLSSWLASCLCHHADYSFPCTELCIF